MDADQESAKPFWVYARVITLPDPFVELGVRERQRGQSLLSHGAWQAAYKVLHDLYRRTHDPEDHFFACVVQGLHQLERLAFAEAEKCLRQAYEILNSKSLDAQPVRVLANTIAALMEGAGRLAQVTRNTEFVEPSGGAARARSRLDLSDHRIRDLIAYLIAAARCRLNREEPDFAVLFAYRATEMVLQWRFAIRTGQLPDAVDWQQLFDRAGVSGQEFTNRYNQETQPAQPLREDTLPSKLPRDLL